MRSKMIRTALVFAVMAVTAAFQPASAQEEPPLFSQVEAFATKTGFRVVFAWESVQPVSGFVSYGRSPDALDLTAQPLPGAPDTAQMAVAFLDDPGGTYYFQVTDQLTGEQSEIGTFEAVNAYTDYDGTAYTIDLLVQLDTNSLPADVPVDQSLDDIAQGISITAERLYDALDGHARLGNVLVTDTNLDFAGNIPAVPAACFVEHTNVADVLVQTTVPFDSHTFGGFAVDDPCTAFYVGRLGQLVVPWEDDLHFGYVAAHELLHYAFSAPDLYAESGSDADCRNLAWDGSIMHNTGGWNGSRWELTELDRNPALTPCDQGSEPYSWDVLRERYTEVPLNADGPIDHVVDALPRGNEDGGALDILILDREPGASTLTEFAPSDAGSEGVKCKPGAPQVTDAEGDANGFVVTGTPGPSEAGLDVLEGRFTWNGTALTSRIKVTDLATQPPSGSVGDYYRFYFTHGSTDYLIVASRDARGEERRLVDVATNTTIATGLKGSFDAESEIVSVVVPASAFPEGSAPVEGDTLTGLQVLAQRYYVALTPTADEAIGTCPYVVGEDGAAARRARPDGRGRSPRA